MHVESLNNLMSFNYFPVVILHSKYNHNESRLIDGNYKVMFFDENHPSSAEIAARLVLYINSCLLYVALMEIANNATLTEI